MNNNQFRRLLAEQSSNEGKSKPAHDELTPKALDGKKPSFTGMMPRNLKRGPPTSTSDRTARVDVHTAKKFKSAAPKGSNFAAGYVDRARARNASQPEVSVDDKALRIRELEEQRKRGDISMAQFEELRDAITAGDVSSTHLIKGLDRQLLDRVRRGEDVLGVSTAAQPSHDTPSENVDDELDQLENAEMQVVPKKRSDKQGVKAVKPLTRDEIMAELKAKRQAAAEAQRAAEPELDTRWRRIDNKNKSRIEIDKKGREVLITVDEDGIVKRRVRKMVAPVEEQPEVRIDPTKDVLGADLVVPTVQKPAPPEKEVESDDDIFAGVGADYDPLGDELSEDEEPHLNAGTTTAHAEHLPTTTSTRNYFNDKPPEIEKEVDHLADIKNVIERAAKLSSKAEMAPEDEQSAARRAKHAEMLANRDRDLEDMDMGFGASRYEDGEDGDQDSKVRLSEWKGRAEDNDDEPEDRQREKKRKPKKRKGDANSIADIMGVIERRKERG